MANISAIKLPDGVTYNIKDDVSGYITGMTILSYGSSTWQNFIDAYNANKVVYCRASSNSNPATGSQTRLAFMAYVNNATTPTEVEFQYYRSVSSHTNTQQGDQVYVYKLNKSTGWSVTTREAYTKMVVNNGITSSYTTGTSASMTISLADAYGDTKNPYGTKTANYVLAGPTSGSAAVPSFRALVAADIPDLSDTYLTSYTETDPTVPSWAKESSKPSYTFSELTTHPTSISGYGITDAYTKTEVDSKVSAVLKYKGVKATIADLPSSGNVVGDTWHVTATSGEYAWDGTEWQELGTAISIPANTGSSTTGITIANHSTDSIYGVSSSTTSVYGVSTSTTTASKVTVGSHSTDYGVTAAGSGSASLTFAMDTTDTKKLVISFSHTHTAPTLGSKVPTVSASDVTVPIKNADATTVPIKNVSATTVITSATHSVTDNGHTHTI